MTTFPVGAAVDAMGKRLHAALLSSRPTGSFRATPPPRLLHHVPGRKQSIAFETSAGSGTTVVDAHKTGLHSIGFATLCCDIIQSGLVKIAKAKIVLDDVSRDGARAAPTGRVLLECNAQKHEYPSPRISFAAAESFRQVARRANRPLCETCVCITCVGGVESIDLYDAMLRPQKCGFQVQRISIDVSEAMAEPA